MINKLAVNIVACDEREHLFSRIQREANAASITVSPKMEITATTEIIN